MNDEKERHNHTGQTPSDIPSEELINPKKKGSRRENKENSTSGKEDLASESEDIPGGE